MPKPERQPAVHTPWGPSQDINVTAPGVTWYSTASHGGYHVTPEVIATWPATLRDYSPWAGPGWFEEDEDWSIVCAAMPRLFNEYNRHAAVRTMRRMRNPERFAAFFASAEGQALVAETERWEAAQGAAKRYQRSGGYGAGHGWTQWWTPVGHDGPRLQSLHRGYPGSEMPTVANRAELEALGYQVVEDRPIEPVTPAPAPRAPTLDPEVPDMHEAMDQMAQADSCGLCASHGMSEEAAAKVAWAFIDVAQAAIARAEGRIGGGA